MGQDGSIKLGDLGISREVNEGTQFLSTFCGTPLYASPELFESKPYNEKTDIWSLGVVLYEIASLRHPFEGKTIRSLADNICRASYCPQPLGRYSVNVHRMVSALLQKDFICRPSISTVLSWFGSDQAEACAKHSDDENLNPPLRIGGDKILREVKKFSSSVTVDHVDPGPTSAATHRLRAELLRAERAQESFRALLEIDSLNNGSNVSARGELNKIKGEEIRKFEAVCSKVNTLRREYQAALGGYRLETGDNADETIIVQASAEKRPIIIARENPVLLSYEANEGGDRRIKRWEARRRQIIEKAAVKANFKFSATLGGGALILPGATAGTTAATVVARRSPISVPAAPRMKTTRITKYDILVGGWV